MRRIVAAVALATLAACGGDATVTPPTPLAGTWTLQSANGSALPFVQSSNSTGKIEIVDDQLVVSSTGTFAEQGHQRVTYASPPAVTTGPYVYAGTYSATGATVAFLFDGGAAGTATRSGTQLSVVFQTGTFVYSKQ